MTIVRFPAVFPDGQTYGGQEVRIRLDTGSTRPPYNGTTHVMGTTVRMLPRSEVLEVDLEPNANELEGSRYVVEVRESVAEKGAAYRHTIQVPATGGPYDFGDPEISAAPGAPGVAWEPGPPGEQGDPGPTGPPLADPALTGMSVAVRGLRRWRLSGRSLRHIVCFGDSVTQGGGVSGKTIGPPDYLRVVLRNEWGVTVHDGYQPIFWAQSPWRWARGAGWSDAAASASNLGPHALPWSAIRATNAGTRTVTWTRPSDVPVGQITVWWVDDGSTTAQAWSYSISGGTWTNATPTPSAPGTPTLRSTTITTSNPSTFAIRNANAAGTAAASPVFLGIEVHATTSPTGWVVHNVGQAGATLSVPVATSAATTGAVAPDRAGDFGKLFDQWAPELFIFGFSNDCVSTTYNAAVYQTAVNTLVQRVVTTADLVAFGWPEQSLGGTGSRLVANQLAMKAYDAQVALYLNGGVVDFKARWGTQVQASAAGLMESGFFPLHPNATGDLDIGSTLNRFLRVYG